MNSHYQPGLHRVAVITAVLALLPIAVGALVTTTGAGMAFLDWPSSDGQNMFLYPWFQSLRLHPDKFIEHGHRLAAVSIGLVSIALAVLFGVYESRRWARWLGLVVLLLVCGQGWLGGLRVRMNLPELAMLHGLLASWVFAFMSSVAVVTSKSWHDAGEYKVDEWSLSTGISAVLAVVAIQLQYVLGGLLRHQGMAVYEHLGMAFFVLLSVLWVWVGAYTSGIRWLRRNATLLLLAVVTQIGVGLLAFIAKFGDGQGVAVHQSLFQVWTRTGHTIVGMFVWMLAVVYVLRVFRIMWVRHQPAGGFGHSNAAFPQNSSMALAPPSLPTGGQP